MIRQLEKHKEIIKLWLKLGLSTNQEIRTLFLPSISALLEKNEEELERKMEIEGSGEAVKMEELEDEKDWMEMEGEESKGEMDTHS